MQQVRSRPNVSDCSPGTRIGPWDIVGGDTCLDEGQRFEQQVLEGETYAQPDYPEGDFDAGARATRQLMRDGEKLIYQGVLKSGRYVGVPDLLVKRRGRSEFGGWYYEPREIKISSSVHDYHILQVCFYAMLLEKIQGHRPQTASVILADEATETVNLVEQWSSFEKRLAEAEAVIDRRTATDLAVFSGCGECVWQEFCHREATTRNDVTLVADLRPCIDMSSCRRCQRAGFTRLYLQQQRNCLIRSPTPPALRLDPAFRSPVSLRRTVAARMGCQIE